MGTPVFSLTGVSYSYGKDPALNGISLEVKGGESLAVLGANGSGKSTLLKLMDALIFPSSGEISFMGDRLLPGVMKGDFLRCFRGRVGLVFPDPDVQLFCPTVFDELTFGPLQLGLTHAEAAKRAKDLLDMLGMAALAERPPYTLSGGEKKKAAIASALAMDPDVILFDEPTNGLDPRSQVWLFELLTELKKLGKTFVISTHDLSLAWDVADRCAVLDEGHGLRALGQADAILKDKGLLLGCNIIHEHAHRHGEVVHRHSHGPYSAHDEHE